MRSRSAIVIVLSAMVVVLAGCGGSSSDGAKASDSGGGSGGKSGAKVDCTAITKAQQDLLSVQLMAQIRDPESVASLKAGTIGTFDPDTFLASMKVLHALDPYSGPLGHPKPAIDAYEQAANDIKDLYAADPPKQKAIDAYNASIGTTTDFLGHQVAIGAVDQAGC